MEPKTTVSPPVFAPLRSNYATIQSSVICIIAPVFIISICFVSFSVRFLIFLYCFASSERFSLPGQLSPCFWDVLLLILFPSVYSCSLLFQPEEDAGRLRFQAGTFKKIKKLFRRTGHGTVRGIHHGTLSGYNALIFQAVSAFL